MNVTTNQQQTLSAPRWLLRGICLVATFYSAFFAADGIMMTAQFLHDDIPAGKIDSIPAHTNMGPRLRLDNGEEVVFSNQVLYQQPNPVHLAIGDHIEKHQNSFVYVVNGRPLTDVNWVLRNWLLPVRLIVLLAVYLLGGMIYVFKYGHTPIGDLLWAAGDSKRPHRPRTRAGIMIVMVVSWMAAALLATTFFGCIGGCLSGIGHAVRG